MRGALGFELGRKEKKIGNAKSLNKKGCWMWGSLAGPLQKRSHRNNLTESGSILTLSSPFLSLHSTSALPPITESLLPARPLLLNFLQLHVNALEAPALPEGRVQERAQIKAVVVRCCFTFSSGFQAYTASKGNLPLTVVIAVQCRRQRGHLVPCSTISNPHLPQP